MTVHSHARRYTYNTKVLRLRKHMYHQGVIGQHAPTLRPKFGLSARVVGCESDGAVRHEQGRNLRGSLKGAPAVAPQV